jgi:hypothetical protein
MPFNQAINMWVRCGPTSLASLPWQQLAQPDEDNIVFYNTNRLLFLKDSCQNPKDFLYVDHKDAHAACLYAKRWKEDVRLLS